MPYDQAPAEEASISEPSVQPEAPAVADPTPAVTKRRLGGYVGFANCTTFHSRIQFSS